MPGRRSSTRVMPEPSRWSGISSSTRPSSSGFCRVLASMFRAGVGLPEAMTVTAEATNNSVYRKGLFSDPGGDAPGSKGWSTPLARTGLFPVVLRDRCSASARKTATLMSSCRPPPLCSTTGSSTTRSRSSPSLFEPAVIIFMGVVRRLRRSRPRHGHVRHLPPSEDPVAVENTTHSQRSISDNVQSSFGHNEAKIALHTVKNDLKSLEVTPIEMLHLNLS